MKEVNFINQNADFNKNDDSPVITLETTKYHISLLVSLIAFLIVYSMPWVRFDSLSSLASKLAVSAVEELSGIGFAVSIILAVPMILAVTLIVLVIRKKKVQLLAILSSLVMIAYWIVLFLIYTIAEIAGKKIELEYSFRFSFYLILLLAIVILVIGVKLPEKPWAQKKGNITIESHRGGVYNNALMAANVLLLLIFIFAPLLQYNPDIWEYVGKSDAISDFIVNEVKIDIGIDKFIYVIKLIMIGANTILKIVPVILIVVYLINARKGQGKLKSNIPVLAYTLVVFHLLWGLIKPIDQIVVISNAFYLAVGISIILLAADTL